MCFRRVDEVAQSIDASKVDIVVNEIQKLGGDAIGVAGDVAADDFPERIVEATIQYAIPLPSPARIHSEECYVRLHRKYGKINHIVNNGGPLLITHRNLRLINVWNSRLHVRQDASLDVG